jgi:hypothetical protein
VALPFPVKQEHVDIGDIFRQTLILSYATKGNPVVPLASATGCVVPELLGHVRWITINFHLSLGINFFESACHASLSTAQRNSDQRDVI